MKEIKQVIEEIKKAVVGKDEIIEKIIMTLLARGHFIRRYTWSGKNKFSISTI